MTYDLDGKVDIFIQTYKDNWFGIQLRLDTKNSNYFAKQKKPYRNVLDLKFLKKIIDLPLNLSTARSIDTKKNDLKVYSEHEFQELIKEINKIEKDI